MRGAYCVKCGDIRSFLPQQAQLTDHGKFSVRVSLPRLLRWLSRSPASRRFVMARQAVGALFCGICTSSPTVGALIAFWLDKGPRTRHKNIFRIVEISLYASLAWWRSLSNKTRTVS